MSGIYAHLGGAGGRPHDLVEHLRDVARRARHSADLAAPGLGPLAEVAGWLHDLGKFRAPFQDYLLGLWRGPEKQKRHAAFGAAAACLVNLPSVAFAILGHHAGLHDLEGADQWKGALLDPDLEPMKAAPDLLRWLESATTGESPPWRRPVDDRLLAGRNRRGEVSAPLDLELKARMLFSCLVDADYLDTERYFTGGERQPILLDAPALAGRLAEHVGKLTSRAGDDPVTAARREVFEACVRAAEHPSGLFSLTAPTGSGKTLAAMAFALEHARRHGLRRVIVVLPFLAIIEQNARVYREALNRNGEADVVLEHHSAVASDGVGDDEDASEATLRAKQATENWDAPVIVTTAVQFLESLFSRRPGRCRKLHNIARSVVVFDEVQTLPFPLLDPILSVLRDLAKDYGVTSLLCSATRPKFAESPNLPNGFRPDECREVIPDRRAVFSALGRARLEAPFLTEGKWSWGPLADRLEREPKALVIVNLRKHAQALYDVLKMRGFANLFHLSSTMCPAHRERVLGWKHKPEPGTIYGALKEGRCLVVSTQVVEAGVDIDFPVVYRAVSPLDSIIQAAGRCDREGTLTRAAGSPAGRVVVFSPEGEFIAPPGYYDRATGATIGFLTKYAGDLSRILEDPTVFEDFHALLIAEREGHESAQEIQRERRSLNFKTVDGLFKVIDEAGQGVVVPYGEGAALIEDIRSAGNLDFERRRKLQRFTVGLMPKWIAAFRRCGVVEPLLKGQEDGPLCYIGDDYDKEAIGLRLGELPPESFNV